MPIEIMRYHILPMRREIIKYDYLKIYRKRQADIDEKYKDRYLKRILESFKLNQELHYDMFWRKMIREEELRSNVKNNYKLINELIISYNNDK